MTEQLPESGTYQFRSDSALVFSLGELSLRELRLLYVVLTDARANLSADIAVIEPYIQTLEAQESQQRVIDSQEMRM
jgi:hypothetical protein